MKKYLLHSVLFLFVALAAHAQVATGLPYECSFEESENLSAWTLNYGSTPTTTDKWMIGTAVHSEGKRSMYISKDGSNPNYGGHPNVVVSFLRYQFPVMSKQQSYDVSFDWKGMGDSTVSKMYVLFGLETEFYTAGGDKNLNTILTTSGITGRLSNTVKNQCQSLGESGEKFVCGSELWQNVSFTGPVNVSAKNSSKVFMFVFIWENSNSNDSIRNSSIAVDNFQINSNAIKKPEHVQAYPQCADSTMLVTWESTSEEFDVEYRLTGASKWSSAHGLRDGVDNFVRTGESASECSYVLPRILEGTYDIRVRAVSRDEETETVLRTSFVYLTQVLVYCPENHCVNYIDIHDTTRVTCTYGMNPEYRSGETPYDNIGCIDYGPDSEMSRHTVHKDPTELDPRTDTLLHTVPPGSLASVRLGNWHTGGEAESITYDITVDSIYQGILIVKYAVVLEDPSSSHTKAEEPMFNLEVLDQNGQLIDATCGKAEFTYSDGKDAGWNDAYSDGHVVWKDWTTIGVNLMPYHGQTIKVRFTTYDCGQGGHYAYAYFTLDCANAHIATNNCGNDASITCYAPEGFNYYWYKDNVYTDSVGDTQELVVDPGRHTYTCRVSFVEEPDCWFEISTISAPRFPVPEYKVEPIFGDCKSKLRFTNTSHVMNKYEGIENHTDEPCEDWSWWFRRLSNNQVTEFLGTRDPIYFCPSEGDSIEVTMTCYIGAENACDSTRRDTIVVPNIYSDTARYYYSSCPENSIYFDGQWFNKDTVYVAKNPNFAGCDSVSILYLDVYPESKDVYRHDSICSDQALIINGVKYNTPLDSLLIMLKTVHGCDSAMYLTLTVNQRIKTEIDSLAYTCADEQNLYIPLTIDEGVFDSLAITFSTPELRDTVIYDSYINEVNIPYSENITPGHYIVTFTFYQFCCGTHVITRSLDVRYRSSIVEQKWNDVLTLLSPKYNGGFEFTAYQWYKNGEPIMGENHSYLYQPLDTTALYYVELTRADGVVITSCPMQPTYHEQQTKFPTLVTGGQRVPMYMMHSTTIWYYTVSGQLYSTFTMPQGHGSMPTPTHPGVYIIKSVNSEGEIQAQTMIVE